MADPIASMIQQALSQGFRKEDLVVVVAEAGSEVAARFQEQGMSVVDGVVPVVMPKQNFGPAFPDAPGGVREAVFDRAPGGGIHAVRIGAMGDWELGEYEVK